jgi:hypothetical protein
MGKRWYASKTLWLNIIGIAVIALQTQTGFVIDAEAQAAILAVINLVLRLVTKEPLEWSGPSAVGRQRSVQEQKEDKA